MGIAERKQKEKEHLKKLILSGAKKLFLEKGIEKTTIRNIADEINYSIGTVYVYFKNKNEILSSLHTQGFKQLGDQMQPLMQVSDPLERLKALGHVYIKFAMENPDMYNLMFSMEAPISFLEESQKEEWNEGIMTFEMLKSTVEDCLSSGHFKGHNTNPLTYLIWGTVHGITVLNIKGRIIKTLDEDPNELIKKSYNEFIQMMDK